MDLREKYLLIRGSKWTLEKLQELVIDVKDYMGVDYMPTKKDVRSVAGKKIDAPLQILKISYRQLADSMGLDLKGAHNTKMRKSNMPSQKPLRAPKPKTEKECLPKREHLPIKSDEGLADLCDMILFTAAKDYCSAYRLGQRYKKQWIMKDLKSGWMALVMRGIDQDMFIKNLQELAEENKNKKVVMKKKFL